MRKFPHHICGHCYWLDEKDFCNFYPEAIQVFPENYGCNVWACVGCLGCFDEDDHLDCLDAWGIIQVVQ